MINSSKRFYIAGGTLRPDVPSYVERRADADLYEALAQSEFCYILTSRQMGKSSLMARTAARLRLDGVAVAVLDLAAIGQNLTIEHWYDGLLTQLGRHLNLEDGVDEYWLDHERQSPLQRWMGALREVVLPQLGVRPWALDLRENDADPAEATSDLRPYAQGLTPPPLVIFIDEIDAVRSLPFSTDEFFAAIRECYNLRTEDPSLDQLTFCLLGVASPSDLIQDVRTTPFNIGRRIELTDFSEAEAEPLAKGLSAGGQSGRTLLQRVLYWTSGHPYLTQRLCQAVAEDDSVPSPAGVDRHCRELFLTAGARERDDNLTLVRDSLLRHPGELSSLLDLYGKVLSGKHVGPDPTSPLMDLLRLSGITRLSGSRLVVRNRIYKRVFDQGWVTEHMPDAELRRQREAYRRGLVRASAVAGAVLIVIAGLALTAVDQARLARRASRQEARQRSLAEQREATARRYLYVADVNMADQAAETGNFGRAVDLLEEQRPGPGEEDLRGFEWRYLWRLCSDDSSSTLSGHKGFVNTVAFSPDGQTLVTGDEHTVRLWDFKTHTVTNLTEHATFARCAAFSRDGKILATGSDDGITLWKVAQRRVLARLPIETETVFSVAFSPDGKTLASGGGIAHVTNVPGELKLWDLTTRKVLASLRGHEKSVRALAFSPDGKTLVTGGWDNTVRLWDAATRRASGVVPGYRADIIDVAFSPAGRTFATASSDGTTRIWDAVTRRSVAVFRGHSGGVWTLAYPPDGKVLATGGEDALIRLWNIATRQAARTLKGHRGLIRCLAFSPDGKMLATGSRDGAAKLWDIVKEPGSDLLNGGTGGVIAVAFSPRWKFLATAGDDRTIRLWEIATGQAVAVRQRHKTGVASLAFSSDGKTLASGSIDGTAILWALPSMRVAASLQPHVGPVASVALSPDGKHLALGGAEGMELWDLAANRGSLTVKTKDTYSGACVTFSPDGKILASVSLDRIVELRDVATRRKIATLPEQLGWIQSMVFSPDGKLLVTGASDDTVTLWDLAARKELVTRKGHNLPVRGLAFSPDGKTLASASADGTVKLWNVATTREVATLKGSAAVMSVAFSPDNSMLVTGEAAPNRALMAPASAPPERELAVEGRRYGRVKLWRAASFAETDTPAEPRR